MAWDDDSAARARRGTRDLTDLLPTAILAHILSFLPLRSALHCGTVSKAWRAACREMRACGSLDFGPDLAAGLSLEQYSAAVDGGFAAHEAAALDTLRIFFRSSFKNCPERRVRAWLQAAASKRPRVLELDFSPRWKWKPRVPASLLNSRCLVQLRLGMCRLPSRFFESIQLPSLQMLSLQLLDVKDAVFARLLHGSPALASLELSHCFDLQDVKISLLPCLRTLTMIDCLGIKSLEIDVPSLTSLCMSDYNAGRMVLKDVSGLEDAYMIQTSHSPIEPEMECRFMSALNHVTNLTLLSLDMALFSTAVLSMVRILPLTFGNLKSLWLLIRADVALTLLCGSVHIYNLPVLERLFIEFVCTMPDWYDWSQVQLASFSPGNKLKVVTIKGLARFKSWLGIAEAFLGKVVCLETLVMLISEPETIKQPEGELSVLQNQVEALPKLSQNVRILLLEADNALTGMDAPVPPHAKVHKEVRVVQEDSWW